MEITIRARQEEREAAIRLAARLEDQYLEVGDIIEVRVEKTYETIRNEVCSREHMF